MNSNDIPLVLHDENLCPCHSSERKNRKRLPSLYKSARKEFLLRLILSILFLVIVCGLLYLFGIIYDFLASNYPNFCLFMAITCKRVEWKNVLYSSTGVEE
ncbi:hypothetical protein CRE_06961 [Caenorhabditis remanei]|uniref:Uncharacterized protein n=1 Tax=Caenorhabditis remanei TaxID=31234 RepID=E3N6M9_CAERE|nr:hypothetical protein CRE_06961 [Caenorhabditis remanei]